MAADILIAKNIATRQAQLAASKKPLDISNAEIQLVQTRWFGTPALYTPPPIANTTIEFFDVQGDTQDAILASFDQANICKKYGPCQVDPAVPKGTALGLEWFQYAGGSYYTCYTPAGTTLPFHEYVLLPRWSPAADGSVTIDLVERWNALAQVIYTHEAGHVAIDKQDLAALNAQAHRLASCNAL